jgi:hypothetical protein
VTCAFAQRPNEGNHSENSTHYLFQKHDGIDFITELPNTHSFNAIMVIVDSVSKQSHFIPMHTMDMALGSAQLYLQNVWKLHGLPKSILSDRGPQFVAEFMHKLYRLLGIMISSSTAYHSQSNGQTKRVNQELKQYILVFMNEQQDNWNTLFPLREFAYNNHTHTPLTLLLRHQAPSMNGFQAKSTTFEN